KARRSNVDLSSPEGLAVALRSPAQSVRYLAWTKLKAEGRDALPALTSMWKQGDGVLRARALWLLGGLGRDGADAVQESLHSNDPAFRILAVRVLKLYGADMVEATRPLL